MIIEYLGHSAFLIKGKTVSVVTDPFDGLGYKMRRVKADVCISSHDHFDHDAFANAECAKIIRGLGKDTCPEIEFERKIVAHDEKFGTKRGMTAVMKFRIDDVEFIHFGDIGRPFRDDAFFRADVCFVPVGGFYTIDAADAKAYAEATRAKIIIPMHFRTARSFTVLSDEKAFTEAFERVEKVKTLKITKETLPTESVVYTFDCSRF